MEQNFVHRFTGRAAVYAGSRPGYPDEILEILTAEIGFDQTKIVADHWIWYWSTLETFLAKRQHCIRSRTE